MIIDYNKIIEKHLGINTPQWIKDNVYSCLKEIESQGEKINNDIIPKNKCIYGTDYNEHKQCLKCGNYHF